MAKANNSYANIFKTTFLFGFVQIVRLLISIVKNKVIAVLLGPQGVGTISIYNNAIDLIKTGAGLGVSQSAVKDISESNASGDVDEIAKTISIVKKIVIFTSVLGLVVTVCMSPLLSKIGFGSYDHTINYIFLSLAVFFNIFLDNQLSILKGMRKMKVLAKTSLVGSIIALVVGLPSIYLLGEKGIIISIIASAIVSALYTSFFVHKLNIQNVRVKFKELYERAIPIMGMGISLMASNFLAFVSNLIIIGYIQKNGGLAEVGFFHAGSALVVSYFSVITTAMSTDFYPRLSECANDHNIMGEEVDKQSRAGLIILQPLITTFVLLSPIIISILYTSEFVVVKDYIDTAIFGVVLSMISNCYGYVIIVKRAAKFYFFVSLIFSFCLVPLYIIFYGLCGIKGLGLAYTIDVAAQFIVYFIYCYRNYKIGISKRVILDLGISLLLIFISMAFREVNDTLLQGVVSVFLIFCVTIFAVIRLKKDLKISFKEIIIRKK